MHCTTALLVNLPPHCVHLNVLFLNRKQHREVLVFLAEHGHKPTAEQLQDQKNGSSFFHCNIVLNDKKLVTTISRTSS